MNRLEIPFELPSFDIHGHCRVAEQIVAALVPAVRIRAVPAHGQINNAALLVHGESKCPNVVAGSVFPTLESPGFVSWLALARDRMEFPQLFSGASVVVMGVSRLPSAGFQLRGNVPLAWPVKIRSHEDDVLINCRRAVVRDLHFDLTVVPE